MTILIQEKHNHNGGFITVKKSRRSQKIDIHLADQGSGLAFFSTHLRQMFGSKAGNKFELMWRRKAPHKQEFVYFTFRRHSSMTQTDLIE